ncbi:SPW repeat protein [Arthrobacter castelli]|uniref:SPW repeat protein n=1 Tax=Arthrobacter castelli TaxID=271431 RepID=UPI0004269311|nr:SPW repeat protein [Arthrobacter castelli]
MLISIGAPREGSTHGGYWTGQLIGRTVISVKAAWRTWQNWVGVVVGVYTALCPIWTPAESIASMALIIGGLLIAIAGIFALGTPVVLMMDWLQAAMGLGLFISPWLMVFSDELAAAVTAWIVGAITLVVGLHSTITVQKDMNRQAKTRPHNYPVT